MGSIIALIPARVGSKGIPGKNFRMLGSLPLYEHAISCAYNADIPQIVVSSDAPAPERVGGGYRRHAQWLDRPAALAQDDTPMIRVVEHALAEMPGDPDDIIVLLQPTQPFRTPAQVREAIQLLRETGEDSVVSVVPVPPTLHPDFQCCLDGPWLRAFDWWSDFPASLMYPTRRQDVTPTYRRDGTVYAFWRKTVTYYGTIYGYDVRPLLIDPADSCDLDTEADWAAVETRWATSPRRV